MNRYVSHLKCLLLTFALLFATSCGKQPKLPAVPGVKGPLFNVMDGKILITMKFLKANLNVGGRIPIPKTKDSYFEVSPNIEDGGILIVFTIDVDDLEQLNIGQGNPNLLPDGRAIPGVAGGTLQNSVRLDTDILDMSFYLHPKLFGIYLPMQWDTKGFAGYWNIIISGKNAGTLSAVASDNNGNHAGLLVFLRLDALKDKELQNLIDLSEKNKNIKF